MSLVSANKTETNTYTVEISVSADDFKKAVQDSYFANRKKIQIPGFRKGKAPKHLIESMYGEDFFYEDALEAIFPKEVEAAYKEAGIEPVDQPRDLDVKTMNVTEGLSFTFNVTVKPEITLKQYKGIEAEKEIVEVTDEEIDGEIKYMLDRGSRLVDVDDRPVQKGDITIIDFEGFVDGVAFDGGKAEKYSLTIGDGQFIPGFEDQVVGHSIGDEFDVNVTFPADYQAENLAGKDAVFKCKLNGIKYTELPAVDDEFARDVSEFDTLDEYKADIRKNLEEQHKKQADNQMDEELIDALIGKLEADIPEVMFENETENQVRDYDNRLRMNGLDLKTYFQYTGLDLDGLRKQMRPGAERQVKTRLALERIGEKENLTVTDEEVEAEYARLAEQFGMEADKVKEAVDRASIEADLKVKAAIELVREKAVVTEVEPTPAPSIDSEN